MEFVLLVVNMIVVGMMWKFSSLVGLLRTDFEISFVALKRAFLEK